MRALLEKNRDILPTYMVQLLAGTMMSFQVSSLLHILVIKRSIRGKNGKEGNQKGLCVGNTIAGAFR